MSKQDLYLRKKKPPNNVRRPLYEEFGWILINLNNEIVA